MRVSTSTSDPGRIGIPDEQPTEPSRTGSVTVLDRALRVATQRLGQRCGLFAVGAERVRRIAGDTRPPPWQVATSLARSASPVSIAEGEGGWTGLGVDLGVRRSTGVLAVEVGSLSRDDVVAMEDVAVLVSELVRADIHAERAASARELLATASHDLRSPLSVIRAGVDTLTTSRDGITAEQRARIGGLATKHADRMSTMLDQLVTLNGVVQADTSHQVDLPLLIAEVLESNRLVHTLVDITYTAPVPDHPILVDGDRDLITRLFSNLVTNAAIHGGSHIEVGVETDGDEAVVTVTDDGPGMPSGTALEGGATARTDGHGLGLLICMRVVERHGGSLSHEPAIGGGTRMTVRLPRTPSVRLPVRAPAR